MSSNDTTRPLVAIVGPTGSGKSELALVLCRRFGGEVVSCDALSVYRGLNVGTAKLPTRERENIPHHLIDVAAADEDFSAARYLELAVPAVEGIANRGRIPFVVGGTGLYLRALLRGLFEGPGRSPEVRERLSRIAGRRGVPALHRILRRWDPDLAARVHPNDRVRLVRGIEVYLSSGQRMSVLMAARRRPLEGFQDILIGLRPSRDSLKERISARVERMFANGLVEEVQSLRERYGQDIGAFKAIGYREVSRFLAGEIDESEARELTALATLQYAKRQMTWFRREPEIQWFEGYGDEQALQESVADFIARKIPVEGGRDNPERFYAQTGP